MKGMYKMDNVINENVEKAISNIEENKNYLQKSYL